MKKTVEFSEEAIGKINEGLDTIRGLCHRAILGGNEREILQSIQREVIALKKTIFGQAVEKVA